MISTQRETYEILKKIPLVLPSTLTKQLDSQIDVPDSYFKLIKKKLTGNIPEKEVYKNLSNTNSLCLELVQSCNLRCGYCIYSGIYNSHRIHQSGSMPYDTALKSVDLFYRQITSPYRTLRKVPILSFYGGEPLVLFNTLTKVVKYARELSRQYHRDIDFLLTTNGVLLEKGIIKFFVEENFVIDISLDGPEPEHDRFRLKLDGNGSFEDVFNNIRYIKKNYPGYFKEKIRFKITIHPLHDLSAIEDFFLANDDMFSERNVFISQVVIDDSLEKGTEEAWTQAKESQAETYYNEGKNQSWFFHKFFFESLDTRFQSKGTPFLRENLGFTGTCFPGGQKIFVDVNGRILICEKGMEKFPIGNVDDGFDIKVIKKIVIEWRKQIIKRKCWECDCWFFCPMCFAANITDNRFLITAGDCNRFIKRLKKRIKRYLEQKERNDEMAFKHHSTINGFLDSLRPLKL